MVLERRPFSGPTASFRSRAGRSRLAALLLAGAASGCSDASSPVAPAAQPVVDDPAPAPALVAPTGFDCTDDLTGQALFRACVPTPAEAWNGQLVVWAHGYVPPHEPVALPDDAIRGVPLEALVTALGFGYATTSYRANGLVADVAVGDLDGAAAFFEATYGIPAFTHLVGASEGGLSTALALERSSPGFDGGLILCAPTGSFAGQVDYIGDFRVLFDYYFPGVIDNDGNPANTWRPWGTGGTVLIPDAVRNAWIAGALPVGVAAALQASPGRAKELLDVARVAYDPAVPATVIRSALAVLRYNILGTNDAVARLGGNPYDNTRTFYLSGQPFRLNLGVRRIAAAPGARAGLAAFETSGRLRVGAVAAHTTRDPDVPFWQSVLYRAEAYGQGIGPLRFNSFPVDRYGHCAFRPEEVVGAFALLVLRVTSSSLLASSASLERVGVDSEAVVERAAEVRAESGETELLTLY